MKMLEDVMNNRVKSELNITENVYWDYSSEVYSSLKGDLLKSVTDKSVVKIIKRKLLLGVVFSWDDS